MSVFALAIAAFVSLHPKSATISVTDSNIVHSPYNWHTEPAYTETPNPGAYLKLGFTGTSIAANLDLSPLTDAKVSPEQYPLIRYSIDNGPGTVVQLSPKSRLLQCATGLKSDDHTLFLQYVSGYVFLDFWTPVNVLKITEFLVDDGAMSVPTKSQTKNALFLGDSITNGDDDTATFAGGITNAVDTQDATIGYPSVVAAATGSEYGAVAYGGASWDGTAADGHTPGLMTFWSMIDKDHSRLVKNKISEKLQDSFTPIPDDIYVNMGENRTPKVDDVVKLIGKLRMASSFDTNIFIIVPFSGRARTQLNAGVKLFRESAGRPELKVFLLDLGNNLYLPGNRPTLFSVDGQHPLATLHALLGAQIVAERARLLALKR